MELTKSVRRAAVVTAGIAVLAIPVGASAATWLPQELVSGTGSAAYPFGVGIDAHGNVLAAYSRQESTSSSTEVAVRPTGGAWQTPTALPDAVTTGEFQRFAMNAEGDAAVLYRNANVIYAVFRPGTTGVWTAPVSVSSALAFGSDVALDAAGDVFVVDSHAVSAHDIAEVNVRSAATGAWSGAHNVSAGGFDADGVQIAANASGAAVAMWSEKESATAYAVQSAFHVAGSSSWVPAPDVSTTSVEDEEGLTATVTPAGDVAAAWTLYDGSGSLLQSSIRQAATGTWTTPVHFGYSYNPAIATDAAGTTTMAVSEDVDSTMALLTRTLSAGSTTWSAPTVLDSATTQSTVRIAVNASGSAIVSYARAFGTEGQATVVTRSGAAGGWSAPQPISPSPSQEESPPYPALDDAGDGVAVWARLTGSFQAVYAAGLDATPPTLQSLSLPPTVVAQQSVTFSLSAFDVWSPPSSASWTLGDGATATGLSVTHTYAKGGVYPIGASFADGVGTPGAPASGVVVVAPAPAPVITSTKQSHSKWRESSAVPVVARSAKATPKSKTKPKAKATPKKKKSPLGTVFSLSINEPSTVEYAITQNVAGRKSGRKCVAPTAALRKRKAKVCTRVVSHGAVAAAGHVGVNTLSFFGRIAKTKAKLKPGRYTLTITATNADGKISTPAKLTFTIVTT